MDKSFKHMKLGDKLFEIFILLVGVLVLLCVIYPLYYVIIASISNPSLVMTGGVWLYPRQLTLDGFEALLGEAKIWIGYRNTIFYTAAGTMINIIMTVLAAYPLSRRDMAGRRFFTLIILFTMYFNGGLIPTYLLVRDLNMDNTVWAILIPAAISTYNLIVAKTFFENSIPHEIYESAFLDGCSNVRMLISIVLPLSKAILAVLVLYYGVAHWNSYFSALVYLRNEELFPLQIILRDILLLGQTEQMGSNDVGMGEKIKMAEAIKYSVIVISSAPVLLLYPLAQKYFVQGVMIGAIKG